MNPKLFAKLLPLVLALVALCGGALPRAWGQRAQQQEQKVNTSPSTQMRTINNAHRKAAAERQARRRRAAGQPRVAGQGQGTSSVRSGVSR